MFLLVSACFDCSPGELWVLYSKIALPLFPSGKLQHINVIKYLWIVPSWPKIHIDFVIIPHGRSRFFLVCRCRDCSLGELWVLCIATVPNGNYGVFIINCYSHCSP